MDAVSAHAAQLAVHHGRALCSGLVGALEGLDSGVGHSICLGRHCLGVWSGRGMRHRHSGRGVLVHRARLGKPDTPEGAQSGGWCSSRAQSRSEDIGPCCTALAISDTAR